MTNLRMVVSLISALAGLLATIWSISFMVPQGTYLTTFGACLLLFALYLRPSDK